MIAISSLRTLAERWHRRWEGDPVSGAVEAGVAATALDNAIMAIDELTRERDEARAWVRTITAEQRTLTCVYCGEAYPPGSPTHGAEVLTAHIKTCAKHPMRALEERLRRYEEALDKVESGLGDRLLANGPLSEGYAHSVMRTIAAARKP